MRLYENIVIVAPDCSPEEQEEVLKRVQGSLERFGAEIVKVDDWGVRKLAYPIKGKDKGHYFFYLVNMEQGAVVGLEKFYRTMDLILRHMFVVADEKSQGLEKPPDQVLFSDTEGES
ncbi:MAG TPA: 30S ribosomal protein S6 [Syntrophorhabdales bacterium]|nr:30S ribosomal protein S6 [Syntrophorhabdales bacterium]